MPRVKTSTVRNLLVRVCGVQSCAISACGTFAVLGTEAGWIECFNLQSGIRRGTFEDPAVGELRGHNGPVLGLTSDATNSLLTSGGYDGFIKVSCCLILSHCLWALEERVLLVKKARFYVTYCHLCYIAICLSWFGIMKLCRVLVVNATALKWLYTFMQVWSFKGRELKSIVSVGSPVLKMVTHRGNGLSAFLSSYIWGIAPKTNATW